MHPALWLALAIGSEIVATVSLKLSDGFTRPIPVAVVVAGYALSFYALSITLRTIPWEWSTRSGRVWGPRRSW